MNVPDCLIFGCFGGGDSLGCIHTAYIGPVENCGTPKHAKLHAEELVTRQVERLQFILDVERSTTCAQGGVLDEKSLQGVELLCNHQSW